jgi:two-component system cell cycle sensor histidine kinase/response regulator CckA
VISKAKKPPEAEPRPTEPLPSSHPAGDLQTQLARAVEQATDAIVITDPNGAIVYVNPAFERVTGYTSAEVLGSNPRILKSGQNPVGLYEEMWTTLARGDVWSGTLVNKRKDGTLFEEEMTISPVRNGGGRLVNYVAVKRDITRERQLEDQLRQAQKMEAIGRLAGGVAHDFNNLLGIIMGYSEMLLDSLSTEDPRRGQAEQVRKAGDRAARLTRQLLAFSRKQVLEPRILDLNITLTETEKLLHRLIGEDIELIIRPGAGLGCVKADPGQLEQVVMNLVVNSRDAMPRGGRLVLETANVDLDEAYAGRRPDVKPGPYVMLAVTDTGAGIPPECREHIFEPFFTTKESGKGTGLGLATVYGIVNQSGGHIWVYSEVGRGTTFKIYLPRVGSEGKELPREPGRRDSPRGHETILIVEDSGSLRALTRGVLESCGYKVLEARDPEHAQAVFAAHKGPIHLLLSDVVLPGISGRELAHILLPQCPSMKVLYMSGYPDEAISQHGVLEPGLSFLQKPFRPVELTCKVREVLDAR